MAAVLLLPHMALAATCNVDIGAVKKRVAALEESYPLVTSDIGCDVPSIKAHQLLCEAALDANADLWTMARLDDLAWVYAYENATKTRFDYDNPSRDDAFIARRDACTDEACLCNVLQEHTNDSLGGTSPYSQP